MAMSSNLPYLASAIYDWILDNDCTPYIAFESNHPDLGIPADQLGPKETILNISESAIEGLEIDEHGMQFFASFNGVVSYVTLPLESLIAIYAFETAEGFVLKNNSFITYTTPSDQADLSQKKSKKIKNEKPDKKKPKLTIIK